MLTVFPNVSSGRRLAGDLSLQTAAGLCSVFEAANTLNVGSMMMDLPRDQKKVSVGPLLAGVAGNSS